MINNKKLWTALTGLMLTASFQTLAQPIAARESDSTAEISQTAESQVETGGIIIKGLSEHYHTGDEVKLEAVPDETVENNGWKWYIRKNADSEWQLVEGLTTEIFTGEATTNGLQVKVELLDENQEMMAESEIAEIIIDDHHSGEPNAERIYNGFFYNDEVADRDLSDWEGDWQSVYPYLVSGDLDEVFEAKEVNSDTMSVEEYKDYYTTGYETDVDRIVIEDDSFTFYYADGTEVKAEYEYDGYEVLTYERGNRGVRFIFKRTEDVAEMPQYIQFSDHHINPVDSSHFHLYWGDDRETLLNEVTNWPTYFPSELDTEELLKDMLAH